MTAAGSLSRPGLDVAQHRDDAPLDLHGLGVVDVDGAHRRVGGLEAHTLALAVEPLERRLLTVVQPHGDEVAILNVMMRAHDYDVAVVDHGVDHRIALELQREKVVEGVYHVPGELDELILADDRKVVTGNRHRLAGDDPPYQRHAEQVLRDAVPRHQPQPARYFAVTDEQAGAFQFVQVVVDDGCR